MDLKTKLQNEIDMLSDAIADDPENYLLYMERGKLYHRIGTFDKALNDFIKVRGLMPGHVEAQEYISMLSEIFEFRYTDIYNP